MLFFVFLIGGIVSILVGMYAFADSFWSIFFYVFGGIWIFSGVLGLIGKVLSRKAPTFSTSVRILSKLTEQSVDGLGGVTTTKNAYFVVFEFPDGSRRKSAVDFSQYALMEENDKGILEYKELTSESVDFINFTRQT